MITEKVYYNAVVKALNSNYEKIAAIYDSGNKFENAWHNIPAELKTFDPETEFKKLEKEKVDIIFREDLEFPRLLKEIPLSPIAIYAKGIVEPETVSLSIVGTRKATPDGEEIAYELASSIAKNGIQITSGLAMGIDSAAHKGALKSKKKTVAVLARGLDEIYPKINDRLAKEILDNNGAIISEYPLGSEPMPHRFLERNRIISGVSIATILIEAPEKSGSISTARFATEQNRDLFVVPGPANHKNYTGSHKLIREGARLVTSAEEIFTDLGITTKAAKPNFTENEILVLELIDAHKKPIGFDEILEMSNLELSKVNIIIGRLLATDIIVETPNGYKLKK